MADYNRYRWRLNAKQSVKKGDVIMRCEPFAYVVDSVNAGQYCDNCFANFEEKVLHYCKKCEQVWYCSEDCVRIGWQIHKCECKGLKKMKPTYPPNYCRLIVRILFKLKQGDFSEKVSDKETRRFKDLMNHYSDIKDNKERMKDLDKLKEVLQIMVDSCDMPNESELAGIYGRMLVNRFCLLDSMMMPMGTAVYLAGSVFDHSCIPTAYPSFEKKTLVIRSLVDEDNFDIRKVRISYVDSIRPAKWRKQILHDSWYFWCDCQRCHDPKYIWMENTLICDNKECGGPVHVSPDSKETTKETVQCENCLGTVNESVVSKFKDVIGFTKYKFGKLKEDNLVFTDCYELVERQENIFFYLNAWRVKSLNFAFNAALTKGGWSVAYRYGNSNVEGMRYYLGNEHPALGLFLLKMGNAALNLRQFQEGVHYLKEAEVILKTCLGPKHKLVAEEIPKLQLLANEDLTILMANRVAALLAKEEREKKEREEKEALEKILKRRSNVNVNPIWEMDKQVFQQDKEWRQSLKI